MRLYKYFSPEGATRLLSTMALRVTPPDQFNDPFEMCPPIDVAEVDDLMSPENVKRELASQFANDPSLGLSNFPTKWREMFVSELLAEADSEQTLRFYSVTPNQIRSRVQMLLPEMRKVFRDVLRQQREEFPVFKSQFQDLVHVSLRRGIGALCFSKNGRHPLMWAHYADEHKGAVIEFASDRPCFNRGSYTEGVGSFVDVTYTKSRPILNAASGENALRVLALSKAAEWEYEEEMRLLLPLADVDEVVDDKYHLIKVDPLSVQSIICGCRASDAFVAKITEAVQRDIRLSHVRLYKAQPCKKDYVLNYVDLQ